MSDPIVFNPQKPHEAPQAVVSNRETVVVKLGVGETTSTLESHASSADGIESEECCLTSIYDYFVECLLGFCFYIYESISPLFTPTPEQNVETKPALKPLIIPDSDSVTPPPEVEPQGKVDFQTKILQIVEWETLYILTDHHRIFRLPVNTHKGQWKEKNAIRILEDEQTAQDQTYKCHNVTTGAETRLSLTQGDERRADAEGTIPFLMPCNPL